VQVIRYHHEGLEHLLHLAHYAFNSKPPPLLKRVADSSAASFGEGSKWRKVFSAADEQSEDAGAYPQLLQRGQSGLGAAGGLEGLKEEAARSHAVERSWQRVHMALQAANKAQVGAKAEVVLAAVANKRWAASPCSSPEDTCVLTSAAAMEACLLTAGAVQPHLSCRCIASCMLLRCASVRGFKHTYRRFDTSDGDSLQIVL
jgi:hypothetical protein